MQPEAVPSGSLVECTNMQALVQEAAPRIHHLNVSQRSRVHIGPKFITVKQNVKNVEVVKALGLQVETNGVRRVRCGVCVFVCWALVVTCALAAGLLCALLLKNPTLLDLDLTNEWYMRRADWQAMPSYGANYLTLPVRYVLIGHSATPWCSERFTCTAQLLDIQREHQRIGWLDIGPNFLVTGDGRIWEGRGANALGAMVAGWNSRSVSLMFVGDYRTDAPTKEMLEHAGVLLEALVRKRVLAADYTLLGHCQVKPYVITPGPLLLRQLNHFPHWTDVNVTKCLSH